MKSFKILLHSSDDSWITMVDSLNPTASSTYNETLKKEENHRYTLTFSIMEDIITENGVDKNLYTPLLFPTKKIRLIELEDDNEVTTDFVIKSVVPNIKLNSIEYTVVAEDAFSKRFTKYSNGLDIEIYNKTFLEIAEEIKKQSISPQIINIAIKDPNRAFKSVVDGKDIKSSLVLSNSNMYNAFVELCLLFNANMNFIYSKTIDPVTKVEYEKNTIVFEDLSIKRYAGYKLSEDINLTSLGITDSDQNFTSMLRVKGGDSILLPAEIPLEVEEFLSSEVKLENRGLGDDEFVNFPVWTKNEYYSLYEDGLIEEPERDTEEETAAAKSLIKKFLKVCDFMPAFNNTIYNFDYFVVNGLLLASYYKKLKLMIFDGLRKLNIKINIATKALASNNIIVSTINSEIETYCTFLAAECQYFNKLASVEEPRESGLVRSIEKIEEYLDVLKSLYEVSADNDYHSAVANIYGYNTASPNEKCFNELIKQNNEKKDGYEEEKANLEKEIESISTKLEKPNITQSTKMLLESNKKGFEARIKNINKFLDDTQLISNEQSAGVLTNPIMQNGIGSLNFINNVYEEAKSSFSSSVNVPSLQELLYEDFENSPSLVTMRNELISEVYKWFGEFLIETTYENTEEVDSYGLFEQAFSIMYGTSVPDLYNEDGSISEENKTLISLFQGYRTPDRQYSIGFIELSSIEEYEFLSLDIGDKIELNFDRLGINSNIIEVSAINYNLRDFGKSTLTVKKLDESENVLQKLLALL